MKLTRGQRRALEFLKDPDNDLVWEKGGGWWLGDEQTNGKLGRSLINLVLIHLESDSKAGQFERYTINESGLRALNGEKPYRGPNGELFDDFFALVAHNRQYT